MREQAGFSLVELLVALTLLGLLSAALMESLHQGFLAWGQISQRASELEDIQIAQETLRRSLTAAYPSWIDSRKAAKGHVDFDGSADRLDFLAPIPATLLNGGRARFHLGRRQNDLVITVRPELASPEGSEIKTETLLAGLQSMEFSYFGRNGWQNRWQDETHLPDLIRLHVTFPPRDRRSWPDLVVAPRIDVDADCVFDPVSRNCRGR